MNNSVNKYVEDAMKHNKFLPKSLRDFELMSPNDQNLVSMLHIVQLRNEFTEAKKLEDESDFVKNPIKFD